MKEIVGELRSVCFLEIGIVGVLGLGDGKF